MAWNIVENFDRLSMVHERYRRTTIYSERKREFTFGKILYKVSLATIAEYELS